MKISRYRRPPAWVPLLFTFVSVFCLWQIHSRLLPPIVESTLVNDWTNVEGIRFKLFESGIVPFLILWSFIFGLLYYLAMFFCVVKPLKWSKHKDRDIVLASQKSLVELMTLLEKKEEHGIVIGYFAERLHRLGRAFLRQQRLSVVEEKKSEILDADEEQFELYLLPGIWCEIALPSLGFIGTVFGLGKSLSAVFAPLQGAVTTGEALSLEAVIRGFGGMGLAFDTTFMGLFGVVVLGVIHSLTKGVMFGAIAKARDILDQAISGWSNDAETRLIEDVADLRREFNALTDAMASSRAAIEHVISETDTPAIRAIRATLFEPRTEGGAKGAAFGQGVSRFLDAKIGGQWTIQSLCWSKGGANSGTCLIDRSAEDGREAEQSILQFDLFTDRRAVFRIPPNVSLNSAYLMNSGASVLGRANYGDVLFGNLRDGWFNKQLSFGSEAYTKSSHLFVRESKNGELGLTVQQRPQLRGYELCSIDHRRGRLDSVLSLSDGFDWGESACRAASLPDGATVALAGKSINTGAWRIQMIRIREPRFEQGGANVACSFAIPCDLSHDLVPNEIQLVDKNSLVFTTSGGEAYYWSENEMVPIGLGREEWWGTGNTILLRPGFKNWLACVRNDRMTMWRLRRGGLLARHESAKFPREGLRFDRGGRELLSVTPNGNYLVGVGNRRNMSVWEYPLGIF